MVRLTPSLLRVPVIKFRKGGGGAAASGGAPSGSVPAGKAPAAGSQAMSTSAISDLDLPPRYRRRPLTQEEIDIINGGGVA